MVDESLDDQMSREILEDRKSDSSMTRSAL